MAQATRICQVCGKEYPYCKTFRVIKFRWQDVACCPEHGVEFFQRVLEERGQSTDALEKAYPGLVKKDPAPTEEIPDEEQDDDMRDEEDPEDEE